MRYFYLFIASFVLFSNYSHAIDYYWCDANSACSVQYSSPSAGCSAYQHDSFYAKFEGINSDSYANYYAICGLYRKSSDSRFSSFTLERRGSSCPAGRTYNPVMGTCDCSSGTFEQGGQCVVFGDAGKNCGSIVTGGLTFPKIYNSSGQCVSWLDSDLSSQCKSLSSQTKTQTVWVPFGADGKPGKPEVESFGCEASVIDTTHCELPAPRTNDSGVYLPPNGKKCKVGLSFSGNVAGSSPPGSVPVGNPSTDSAGLCPEGVDCTPKPLPIENEKTPCKYEWDASIGMQTCRSSTYKGQPGNLKCGTGPNGFQCFEAKPNSEKMVIDTKVKEEAQGDGTTKITKTDTATKVICTGENACTTINATNTGVTIKDGAGNVVGSISQCTGALCATVPGGKGDTDGDGLKDCIEPAKCDEVTGPKFSENDEVPDYGETLTNFMDQLKEARFIAAATSITIPGGGSCVLPDANVYFGVIRFQTFCDNIDSFLGPILNLIMAMWGFLALRILLSA